MRKMEVVARCGKVSQVFELDVDLEQLDKAHDIPNTDAGVETLLCAFLASGGLDMLRKMTGFQARRIRYECPYPGGYIGPERCYTEADADTKRGEISRYRATMRAVKDLLTQTDKDVPWLLKDTIEGKMRITLNALQNLLDAYEEDNGLL